MNTAPKAPPVPKNVRAIAAAAARLLRYVKLFDATATFAKENSLRAEDCGYEALTLNALGVRTPAHCYNGMIKLYLKGGVLLKFPLQKGRHGREAVFRALQNLVDHAGMEEVRAAQATAREADRRRVERLGAFCAAGEKVLAQMTVEKGLRVANRVLDEMGLRGTVSLTMDEKRKVHLAGLPPFPVESLRDVLEGLVAAGVYTPKR